MKSENSVQIRISTNLVKTKFLHEKSLNGKSSLLGLKKSVKASETIRI